MKFEIKVQVGSESRDHALEIITLGAAPAVDGWLRFILDGEAGEADCVEIGSDAYSILVNGLSHEVYVNVTTNPANQGQRADSYEVSAGKRRYTIEVRDPRRGRHSGPDKLDGGPLEIMAPMPGRIIKVLVSENQEVGQGEGLMVIEAMKMQNDLRAPRAGRVEKIYVTEGNGVEMGIKLLQLG
jgi:biotin carboxyl carrier protein